LITGKHLVEAYKALLDHRLGHAGEAHGFHLDGAELLPLVRATEDLPRK
jgi:hypothetical protein